MHKQKLSNDNMKISNTQLVLNEIYDKEVVSRSELAQITQMSPMTIGRISDDLIGLGLVIEEEANQTTSVGRPPKHLKINSNNISTVGVSIEKGYTMFAKINPYGKIIKEKKINIITQSEDSIEQILYELSQFVDENDTIGFAIPGVVDNERGFVEFSSQLKWQMVNLKEKVLNRIKCNDVLIDNDIKAIALAECHFGVAKDIRNSVLLNIGQGVGAVAVYDKKIFRGRKNTAGEIGHIIINSNGRMCECGKIGCLQANIAEWSILQDAQSVKKDITVSEVFKLYSKGEPFAVNLIDRVVDYISIAINMLINTYSPDSIILHGSMIENNPLLVDLIKKSQVNNNNFSLPITIKQSNFGSNDKVVGGASVAFISMCNKMIQGL